MVDTHVEALKAGKSVYVEKPLAMNEEELAAIVQALSKRGPGDPTFMGRLQPAFCLFKPKSHGAYVGCSGAAGELHHTQGKHGRRQLVSGPRNEGGGMLFGDVCHFH